MRVVCVGGPCDGARHDVDPAISQELILDYVEEQERSSPALHEQPRFVIKRTTYVLECISVPCDGDGGWKELYFARHEPLPESRAFQMILDGYHMGQLERARLAADRKITESFERNSWHFAEKDKERSLRSSMELEQESGGPGESKG